MRCARDDMRCDARRTKLYEIVDSIPREPTALTNVWRLAQHRVDQKQNRESSLHSAVRNDDQNHQILCGHECASGVCCDE